MARHNIRNGWSITPRQFAHLGTVISPHAAFVLIVLLRWATKRDVPETSTDFMKCWPSVEQLAEDTGFSERTVQKALKELDEVGLIRAPRRQGSKAYSYFYLGGLQARLDELFPPGSRGFVPKNPEVLHEEESADATPEEFPNIVGVEPDVNFGPPEDQGQDPEEG